MVKGVVRWPWVMVKELAPGLKIAPLISKLDDTETVVIPEAPNVAVLSDPFGTVLGVQLAAVFQSPLLG